MLAISIASGISARAQQVTCATANENLAAAKKSLADLQASYTSARHALAKAQMNGDNKGAASGQLAVMRLQKQIADQQKAANAATSTANKLGCASSGVAAAQPVATLAPVQPSGTPTPNPARNLAGAWVVHTTITPPRAPPLEYYYDATLSGAPSGPWSMIQTLRYTSNQQFASQVGMQYVNCSMVALARGVGMTCPGTNADGSPGPPLTCPGAAYAGGYAGACAANGFRWEMHRGTYPG